MFKKIYNNTINLYLKKKKKKNTCLIVNAFKQIWFRLKTVFLIAHYLEKKKLTCILIVFKLGKYVEFGERI